MGNRHNFQEDSDIKIAVFKNHHFLEKDPSAAQEDPGELLLWHKKKGNLDKAKGLGRRIAYHILSERNYYGIEKIWENFLAYEKQIRLLICFTAMTQLQKLLPDDILAHSATSSLLDTIAQDFPAFDSFLNESGDFTLYYLAVRRDVEEVELTVGKTFAGLCNSDGNAVFVEYGETLYCRTLSWVAEEVNKVGFLIKEK